MPKEINGERYYNGTEAALFIGSERNLFYSNVAPLLRPYQIGASKRVYYKEEDLLPYRGVRPVEKE